MWLNAVRLGKNDGTIRTDLSDDHIMHFVNLTLTGIIEQTILRTHTIERIKLEIENITAYTSNLIRNFLKP